MSENALLIFTKNLVYGKVKTRLAATVGNDIAFKVYEKLLQYTFSITHKLNLQMFVFYSDEITNEDVWKNNYEKQLQDGNNLGERMVNAFENVFQRKISNAVIIGCDCAELTTNIIKDAFEKLKKHDVVIGPAADGGYYLLGMKKTNEKLFPGIEWSTNNVLYTTVQRCNENNLSYYLLQELHDVDEEKDLQYLKNIE